MRFWESLRSLRGRVATPADGGERERTRPPPVEVERGATRDLLVLDRFVRALHAEFSGGRVDGGIPEIAEGAQFDVAGCRWCPPSIAARRAKDIGAAPPGGADVRLRERARTVHVVADVAWVISTCDVVRGTEGWTVVHCMQLRRSSTGWALHALVSRDDAYAISEKLADPRPLTPQCATRR